jgi:hypothetical protein
VIQGGVLVRALRRHERAALRMLSC